MFRECDTYYGYEIDVRIGAVYLFSNGLYYSLSCISEKNIDELQGVIDCFNKKISAAKKIYIFCKT
jgi:hypothetical protein